MKKLTEILKENHHSNVIDLYIDSLKDYFKDTILDYNKIREDINNGIVEDYVLANVMMINNNVKDITKEIITNNHGVLYYVTEIERKDLIINNGLKINDETSYRDFPKQIILYNNYRKVGSDKLILKINLNLDISSYVNIYKIDETIFTCMNIPKECIKIL